MYYFHQNQTNRIVFANDIGIEVGDLYNVTFLNNQFGEKTIEVIAQVANSRYVETSFECTSEKLEEDLMLNIVWLPTGYSFLSIMDDVLDKVFVEFKPRETYEVEQETKKFVLE